MPKREITTRRRNAATTTTPAPVADTTTPDVSAAADTTPDTTTPDVASDTTTTTPDASDTTTPDTTPDATTTPAPVAAAPAAPDAKAAFLERKAAATLSVVPVYGGASLAVHRSDRQPADGKYLERVASPVQKIGPNGPTPRDNSFILAVYDHLTEFRNGDYSGGFNPANFGADLGTTSRAASVGYLALSADGSDIVLTPAGLERGKNLAAKRAKA